MKNKKASLRVRLPRRADNRIDGGAVSAFIVKHLFIYALGFTTLVPFAWMLSSSLKWDRDVFATPIQWIPDPPRWENYVKVFQEIPFATYYLNSLKIAICVLALQLLTCSMAAFSFTKLHYRGRSFLLLVYIATLMVPSQVTMIPQFMIWDCSTHILRSSCSAVFPRSASLCWCSFSAAFQRS